MPIEMTLSADRSECVAYNSPDVPIYSSKGYLSDFPDFAAVSHWHDDIELVAVLSGDMYYNVNGGIQHLKEGEGIVVNARQLHFGYSPDKTDCEFICVLLHPMLLCANRYMEQKLVAPLLENPAFSYHLLTAGREWEVEVIELTRRIYQIQEEQEEGYLLLLQSLFFQIWHLFYRHMFSKENRETRPAHHLDTLKEMMEYIRQHYPEKMTLEDIAVSGKVCKSTCCQIFKSYLHQAPIGYLTRYRLDRGRELLRKTPLTVSEVGYAAGFSSASYFTEQFRRTFGCTPSQYRKMENQRQTG